MSPRTFKLAPAARRAGPGTAQGARRRSRTRARAAGCPGPGRYARAFGNAWVLMDRIHDGDDSGERLFRYLRAAAGHQRVVRHEGHAGLEELKAAGGNGSSRTGRCAGQLLMLNCAYLISSHADVPVMRPPRSGASDPPTWRFTFLQHGVIKDDLSRWLNSKRASTCSSPAPGPSTTRSSATHRRTTFTAKETRLTGLPRFDRLLEQGTALRPRAARPHPHRARRGATGYGRRSSRVRRGGRSSRGLLGVRLLRELARAAVVRRSPRRRTRRGLASAHATPQHPGVLRSWTCRRTSRR